MQAAEDEAISKQFKIRICFEFWILPENLWSTKNNAQKKKTFIYGTCLIDGRGR